MIIVEDVFVIRHEIPDESYKEADGLGGSRQMTEDEMYVCEADAGIDDAIESMAAVIEGDNIHWSRKVRHVDG